MSIHRAVGPLLCLSILAATTGSCTRAAQVGGEEPAAEAAVTSPAPDLEALRAHMNKVFQAQEIQWSHPDHRKYASTAEQLLYYERDPAITLTILEGTEKGWAGMIQDESGHACAMYVGTVSRVPATPRGQAPQAPKQIACD